MTKIHEIASDDDWEMTQEESISAYLFENFRDGIDEEGATEAGRKIFRFAALVTSARMEYISKRKGD